MKKLYLGLTTIVTLFFVITGMAATPEASASANVSTNSPLPNATLIKATPAKANEQKGYYSTRQPVSNTKPDEKPNKKSNLKGTLSHPTDIAVVNASNSAIYVIVPGRTPYDPPLLKDYVYANSQPYHIANDYGPFWTGIEIHDAYDNYIWSGTVCPHALLAVYGNLGGYHSVYIDNSYC